MLRGQKRKIGLVTLVIAISVCLSSVSFGFQGGAGDGNFGYGGCSCHSGMSRESNATTEMWASDSTVVVSQTVTVLVNVTSWTLSSNNIIGVFLLRSLTANPSDIPSTDGWTILVDPNGNQNNYVQTTVSAQGDTASLQWDLRAPPSSGSYALYARVHHGGVDSYWRENATGLSFVVLPNAGKKLTVTGTDMAPSAGVFPTDNNVTMLSLELAAPDELVTVTSLTFDLTVTSTAVSSDIERIFLFDDLDGSADMDWFELMQPNYGVLASVTNPVFPQTISLSAYSVGPSDTRYVTVYLDIASGSEFKSIGLELVSIVSDDPSPMLLSSSSSNTQAKPVIWSDEMESGVGGWSVEGGPVVLWHLTDFWSYVSESPTHSWWYGSETNPDPLNHTYFVGPLPGQRNYGNLTSEPIDLTGYSSPTLSFWQDLRTENQAGVDLARLLVEDTATPGTWSELGRWITTSTDNWTKATVDIDAYGGQTIRLRFFFDTVDDINNHFRGWLVDRIHIFGYPAVHDIGVQSLSAPSSGQFTDAIYVNATIVNVGGMMEDNATSGIDAWLRIDGVHAQLNNIASIPIGGSQPVSFQWTPSSTGNFELCVHAWPVFGETNIGDNTACKTFTSIGDTTMPTSSVEPISPYWEATSSFDVEWTATDDQGLANISLFFRYSDDNSTWSAWDEWAYDNTISGTSATGIFQFTATNGDGYYEFYTIAIDALSNVETAPLLPDVKVGVDTTRPTGSIIINNDDPQSSSSAVTLSLTFSDALSGVSMVRFSNDGVWDTESWESPSTTRAWTTTSGDGMKTVYYQVVDRAGLESATYSDDIELDTDGPRGVTHPTVISVNPQDNEPEVDVTTNIVVEFDESMNEQETGNAFSLMKEATEVQGTTSWSDDGETLTFIPNNPLEDGTTYRIRVSTDAEDVDGNRMESVIESVFTTMEEESQSVDYLWAIVIIIIATIFALIFLIVWRRRARPEEEQELIVSEME